MRNILFAVVSLGAITGCGNADTATATGSSSSSGGDTCADYGTAKAGASFKDDVIPVFQLSCNFSSCHNAESPSPQGKLALGLQKGNTMTADDIKTVYDRIVGGISDRSSLAMVEPGAPEKSWLVAKISYADFGACPAVSDTCGPQGCGGRMPLNSPALSATALDAIAGWVKDGAKNN